jgi:hypothetical protein
MIKALPPDNRRHLKCGCVDQRTGNGHWRALLLCARHTNGRSMTDVT